MRSERKFWQIWLANPVKQNFAHPTSSKIKFPRPLRPCAPRAGGPDGKKTYI